MKATVERATTEKQWLQQVRDLARLMRWREFHTHDSRRSPSGLPDLVLVRPPRVVFAELKREKGRLSPPQEAWLEDLRACPGVETYVWRPRDWDRIVEVLQPT